MRDVLKSLVWLIAASVVALADWGYKLPSWGAATEVQYLWPALVIEAGVVLAWLGKGPLAARLK